MYKGLEFWCKILVHVHKKFKSFKYKQKWLFCLVVNICKINTAVCLPKILFVVIQGGYL